LQIFARVKTSFSTQTSLRRKKIFFLAVRVEEFSVIGKRGPKKSGIFYAPLRGPKMGVANFRQVVKNPRLLDSSFRFAVSFWVVFSVCA
jgi:hypothetical protein